MDTATWRTRDVAAANGHGTKRRAGDDLESAQRLVKRFHLLNIGKHEDEESTARAVMLMLHAENKGKLWIQPQQQQQQQPDRPRRKTHNDTERMQLEDTKDRVYIHDLDEELANISDAEDEDRMIFLPDIEKRFNKVPRQVLMGDRPEMPGGGELVIYRIPKALSVPEEEDSVRRAIIETRARAREQQPSAPPSHDAMLHDEASQDEYNLETAHEAAATAQDEDAMDLG